MTPYYHKAGSLEDVVENIQNYLTRQESAVAATAPVTPPTGLLTLNGDVAGLASDNVVQALQGVTLTISSLTTGDILLYDGTKWANSAAYITTAPATSARNVVAAGAGVLPLTLAVLDTGGGADSPALRPSLLQLRHRTTLATVSGVGGPIDWIVPDDAAADQTIASLIGEITTPTAGAVDATIGVVVKKGSLDVEVVRFRGAGTGSMAATNVGTTSALKGYTGGQMWVRGNALFEGVDGNTMSITDAATSTPVVPLIIQHLSTGTPAAGLGAEIDFVTQDSNGVKFTANFIRSLYAGGTVAGSTANSTFVWGGIMNNTQVEMLRFRTTVGMAPSGGVGGQVWCRADFRHDGTSLGFYNTTPIAQPSAYTLAGSATRTFPTDPSSAYTGLASGVGGTPYAALTDLNTLRGVVSSLEGVLRQVVSDLGKTSGVGLNAT